MTAKIGIIEICEPNHYLAASVMAKIYASEPINQVYLFLEESIAFKNKPENLPKNILIIIKTLEETWEIFIAKINALKLDVLHINTVSKHLNMFSELPFEASKISLSVHNIEEFFDNGIATRAGKWGFYLKKAFQRRHFKMMYVQTVLFFKSFWRQSHKNKFIHKLLQKNYRLVVYTQGQANYLSHFVDKKNIIMLPMALYEPFEIKNIPETTPNANKMLRIAIPGVVSNDRRDYSGLLEALEQNISLVAGKFIWDFLGFLPENEPEILQKIEKLKTKNIDIQYYTKFISENEFDKNALKADVILGNLKTQLNPFQQYGQTKESTTVFHMLKYAKMGLLPADYPLDDHFKQSSVTFENYEDLIEILLELSKNKEKRLKLEQNALELAEKFTAKMVFQRDLQPFI
jgi:hypothetical protein